MHQKHEDVTTKAKIELKAKIQAKTIEPRLYFGILN